MKKYFTVGSIKRHLIGAEVTKVVGDLESIDQQLCIHFNNGCVLEVSGERDEFSISLVGGVK